ncbi:MAG: glycosyltransferase [Microthrixaceae bacterium]
MEQDDPSMAARQPDAIDGGGRRAATAGRAAVDLSIVLCTYNGARWLTPMLQSISMQTRPPDEVVVQDDASSDDTTEVVREWARSCPFPVSIEVNDTTLGSTTNFETALRRCRGRSIALADQDDVWYPEKLARLSAELDDDPTLTLVFSDADLIDEAGEPIDGRLWGNRLISRALRHHSVVPQRLFARRAVTTGCTMMVRRRAVTAALPFPEELTAEEAPMRHDRWLSMVAAAVGAAWALPEPLLSFRVHPSQETGVLSPGELTRRLGGNAAAVLRGEGSDHSAHLRGRARQLRVAADRADLVGDFQGARTLRAVADGLDRRAALGEPEHASLRALVASFRAGDHDWDLLGVGAAVSDVVRVIRAPAARRIPAAST